MSLQNLCITSASRYLQFLEENNLGLEEIGVREKRSLEGSLWSLNLARRVFDLDAIQLKVRGQIYQTQEGGHFFVDSYDDETRVLVIKLRLVIPGFDEASDDEVKVISNLRFLVERVRQWFVANGHECRLPERTETEVISPSLDLSRPEQLDAYETVLRLPSCYIWGPPGTGKTRYVLTSAVIARVLQGRRVAILAPTNLALDLAVASVLETCDRLVSDGPPASAQAATLGRENFLRLGAPTREFADRFAEVCEERELERRMIPLSRRIEALKKLIKYRKNRECLPNIDLVLSLTEQAKSFLTKRNGDAVRQRNFHQRVLSIENDLNSPLTKLTGWLTGVSRKKDEELAESRRAIAVLDQQLSNAESEFTKVVGQIGTQRTGSPLLDNPYQEIAVIRVYDEDADTRLEETLQRLSEIRANIVQLFPEGQAHDPSYANWSIDELERELDRVLAEIEALRKRTRKERLRNVRVIGCTVDVFINQFRDAVAPVDHIFLDEAGYTPVIKALTLFRRNIPVTLLGDHKQLPPVCEMRERTLQQQENWPCVLWAKSAVFAKHLLCDSPPPVESLFKHLEEPPSSGQFDRKILTRTHRFGQNLASLLDELFYDGIGFTSAAGSESGVSVEVISVPRMDLKWSNQNECVAARAWLDKHTGKGAAILSPYKNQVALLNKALPREMHDDVLTVNRAQGREWETVIFCAADTMQNPFLTDTTIPQGRLVINTAISRSKRAIVLVCDAEYWSRRADAKRQLLSRLIQIARH